MKSLYVCTVSFLVVNMCSCQLPVKDFYRFGLENGDRLLYPGDDTFSEAIRLRVAFPFEYNLETTVFVNTNGAISFNTGVEKYTPECNALTERIRMITPFWADTHTDQGLGGDIYFRQTMETVDIRKAARDIVAAFPNLWGINIRWLFIATWYRVTFYGANACYSSESDPNVPRNTFQLILATDGTFSFAIFYYNIMTWTAGLASGGEDCLGVGGLPARVGFDVGDGVNFFALPSSCTDDIVKVSLASNMNEPGKWLFRIDSVVTTAECNSTLYSISGENQRLRLSPTFVDAFGNVPISLSGPCFSLTSSAQCIFHDVVKGEIAVNATIFSLNSPPEVKCMVPFLYGTGRINVDLLVWDSEWPANETGSFFGFLTVIWGSANVDVKLIRSAPDPATLRFEWRPELSIMLNATTVTIDMIWFNLISESWEFLATIIPSTINNGSFTSNITWLPRAIDSLLLTRSAIAFKLIPQTKNEGNDYTWAVFSHPICASMVFTVEPLADICERWWMYHSDGRPKVSLPCPPYLRQAEIDPNFETTGWTMDWLKFYRPGAFAAFRARAPNSYGTGQECTYSENGILLVGPPGGGAANMVSPLRSEWRHWKFDIVPWCNCCRNQSDSESCLKYYDRRPSDDGRNYKPPRIALIHGDPHIKTFDDLQYTFNGAGEYWLVKSANNDGLMMQARMMPAPGIAGTTVFTAFVIKDGESIVQVHRSLAFNVEIIMNGYRVDFENQVHVTLSFGSIYISAMDETLTNVLITLPSGISFRVMTGKHAMAMMPIAYEEVALNRQKFSGLLGDMDGNATNDLSTPDGHLVSVNSSTLRIHWDFGIKWIVQENESLFYYPPGKSYYSYYNPHFKPADIELEMSKKAKEICGESHDCLYDYTASNGNVEFANETVYTSKVLTETTLDLQKRYLVCPTLTYLRNGYFNVTSLFYPGSKAYFTCDDGFILSGPDVVECVNDTAVTWNNSIPECIAICQPVEKPLNGIVIPSKDHEYFKSGETVSFICEKEFDLVGRETIKCTDHSIWDSDPPICRRKLATAPPKLNHIPKTTAFSKKPNFYLNTAQGFITGTTAKLLTESIILSIFFKV